MHYVHVDKMPIEHVQFIEENKINPPAKTWVNLTQAHEIDVVQVGFHYYVKISFSPYEFCYIASFDCEKGARAYVKELFD